MLTAIGIIGLLVLLRGAAGPGQLPDWLSLPAIRSQPATWATPGSPTWVRRHAGWGRWRTGAG